MGWYDFIAPLYDLGSAGSGRFRRIAVEQLDAQPGDSVLDLACGTGLNFPVVERTVGQAGTLIGLDASRGMLTRARKRVVRHDWRNVHLIRADARRLDADLLRERSGIESVDRVLCTLGFSVFPDYRDVFDRSYEVLKRGGRYCIMDWYLEKRTPFARFLEFVARGEIVGEGRVWRSSWELLRETNDFTHRTFWGGRIFICSGIKP